MKVGEYVRSSDGLIAKIISIKEENDYKVLEFDSAICFLVDIKENIILKERRTRYLPLTEHIDINKIKHSPNIIDLIEVGDYVNKCRVIDFMLEKGKKIGVIVDADIWGFDADEIKTIVTREQFEAIQYEVK